MTVLPKPPRLALLLPLAPMLLLFPLASALPAAEQDQIGIASFSSGAFHGRATASGEPFDMETLTAAHAPFPLAPWCGCTT